jgi:mRNA interferase RelE/StbE
MYELLLERQAEKDLKHLPPDIFKRVVPSLKQLAENPRPPGCRKLAGAENDWRIRHRREVYR